VALASIPRREEVEGRWTLAVSDCRRWPPHLRCWNRSRYWYRRHRLARGRRDVSHPGRSKLIVLVMPVVMLVLRGVVLFGGIVVTPYLRSAAGASVLGESGR
jgi:hypothetical protein